MARGYQSDRSRSREAIAISAEMVNTLATMGDGGAKWTKRTAWVFAGLLLLVVAFEGQHLAHLLPQAESWVASLGPWGPLLFFAALLVAEPILFPNTLFGMTAGVAFGLWKGFLVYFISVYLANLLVYAIGRRLLRRQVVRLVDRRPPIRDAVTAAQKQGTSLVLWIRMLPLNPAVFSYAFGGLQAPFRSVAIGTLGMFPHMFLDVYLGTAAAHVTKMAEHGHAHWEIRGVGLVLGLLAVAVLSWRISKIARAQIRAAGVDVTA